MSNPFVNEILTVRHRCIDFGSGGVRLGFPYIKFNKGGERGKPPLSRVFSPLKSWRFKRPHLDLRKNQSPSTLYIQRSSKIEDLSLVGFLNLLDGSADRKHLIP